jgi:hypothetical protein
VDEPRKLLDREIALFALVSPQMEALYDVTLGHLSVFTNRKAATAEVKAAEDALFALGGTPGFAQVLLAVLSQADPPHSRPLRQMAATVLTRAVVKPHWCPDKPDMYTVPDGDKAVVRERLPLLLGEPDSAVRSMVAQALTEVANTDWPRQWPGFVDGVLACLSELVNTTDGACCGTDEAAVAAWMRGDGALRCLVDFLDKASGEDTPLLAAALHPALIAIAAGALSRVEGGRGGGRGSGGESASHLPHGHQTAHQSPVSLRVTQAGCSPGCTVHEPLDSQAVRLTSRV